MSDCLCSNCIASQMDSTLNQYTYPFQDSPLDLSQKSTRTAAATAPPVEPPVLPPTNFTTLKDRNSGRVMDEEDDLEIFRQACKEKIASEKARLYGYFGSIINRLVETVFQHLENELENGATGPTEHNGQLLNLEERFNKKFEWATQVFHNTTWDLAHRVRKYDPSNLDVLRAPTV